MTSTESVAEEQPGEPADGEEEEEHQGVAHRRRQADRALVHGRQPVEDLDRRGDGHGEGQGTEDHGRPARDCAADEHVVAPDEEADQGDGHAAIGDEAVAEDVLAR